MVLLLVLSSAFLLDMDGVLNMFKIMSSKKYNEMELKIENQAALLSNQRCMINKSEEEKHNIVEQMRYTLQVASWLIGNKDMQCDAESIAECLPYLLSGFRHWQEREMYNHHHVESIRIGMSEIARKYNFELPSGGYDAVMAMLSLSMSLFYPDNTCQLELLKQQYPLSLDIERKV